MANGKLMLIKPRNVNSLRDTMEIDGNQIERQDIALAY